MSHLNPTPEEHDREQTLPAWARATLNKLRGDYSAMQTSYHNADRKVDELEAQIADAAKGDTGPEDSTAWLWREMGGEELPPLGLGDDAVIDFRPASGIELTVEAHGNGIKVTSQLHLMVIPIGRTEFRIQPVSAKIKD